MTVTLHRYPARSRRSSRDGQRGVRVAIVAGRASRAVILPAVLIAIVASLLAVSAVVVSADSQSASLVVDRGVSRSRLAAWSGVRAALAELQRQRPAMLAGATPTFTPTWIVEEREGRRLVVRLLELPGEAGPTSDDGGGSGGASAASAQSEASKVDVNLASGEAIESVARLDAAMVEAIRDRRASRRFESIGEVAGVIGVEASDAVGRVGDTDESGESTASVGGNAGARRRALADALSVFAADPNVQVGVGTDASSQTGRARINLGMGWSEDLAGPITERFGADAVATVRQLMQGGTRFTSIADVLGVLRQLGVPTRQWGSLLDAFTTTPDPFIAGRIDLLRAGEDTLATVPGIDASAASRIVSVRDRLDGSLRRELTWPVVEGILSPERMQEAIDHVTNRSMQWRIVVEAGFEPIGAGGGSAASGDRAVGGARGTAAAAVRDRVVFEAVLDVAGEVGRVAFLRDLTSLRAVSAMNHAARASSHSGDEFPADALGFEPSPRSASADATEQGEDAGAARVSGETRDGRSGEDPSVGSRSLRLGRLDLRAGVDLSGSDSPGSRRANDERVTSDAAANDESADESSAGSPAGSSAGSQAVKGGTDHRIARWKPGASRAGSDDRSKERP